MRGDEMTDPNKTLIVSLLDRSGSMEKIRVDIQGAYDAFMDAQRKVSLGLGDDHQTFCTLVQFDSHNPFELVYDHRHIDDVEPLELDPRGLTPLNDAFARTILHVGQNLKYLPEDQRPGHVYFVVMTDGLENASKEFTKEGVHTMVTRQTNEWKWEFHFLGVGIDAFEVGGGYGVMRVNTVRTGPSGQSASVGYEYLSANVTRSRTGGQ